MIICVQSSVLGRIEKMWDNTITLIISVLVTVEHYGACFVPNCWLALLGQTVDASHYGQHLLQQTPSRYEKNRENLKKMSIQKCHFTHHFYSKSKEILLFPIFQPEQVTR